MSYRTEEEQLQLFKQWWQENGRQTLIAFAILLSGYFGWVQWQTSEHNKQESASVLYEQWLDAQKKAGSASASEAISTLREQYADTFYGKAALLFLAKESVEQGKLEEAEAHLNMLIEQKPTEDLLFIARLRSAKVLFALGKNDEALVRLKAPIPDGFRAPFSEMRGDVYMAQGNAEKARASYQDALDALGEEGAQNDILKMKFENAQ